MELHQLHCFLEAERLSKEYHPRSQLFTDRTEFSSSSSSKCASISQSERPSYLRDQECCSRTAMQPVHSSDKFLNFVRSQTFLVKLHTFQEDTISSVHQDIIRNFDESRQTLQFAIPKCNPRKEFLICSIERAL